MIFLALGLILYLGVVKLTTYLVQSADPNQAWDLTSASFFMAIPLPAAAMICCLFLGFSIAIYFLWCCRCWQAFLSAEVSKHSSFFC